MLIREMQELRRRVGLTYEQVSELSGVPAPTVQKVLGGVTKSPRITTVQALERVFLQIGKTDGKTAEFFPAAGRDSACGPQPDQNYVWSPELHKLRETPGYLNYSSGNAAAQYPDCYSHLPYKRQGEYTASDRDRLPSHMRTELIDGVIYDMASPRVVHQIISTKLLTQIDSQIGSCGERCRVFAAPSDVWLTGDDKNIFQPDLYVICDDGMIGKDGYVVGAPPFVIEILSNSTRAKDMLLKTYKYGQAGVREYWIVDPEKRKIIVYSFENDPSDPGKVDYSFDAVVPIGISSGHCKIDFALIKGELEGIW